jgi:DNA helicase-2/ATP-dependent DNA helicase PcrA
MAGGAQEIPTLEGEAAEAVAHRGGHLQIIAAAGSGKTEVVSQRVAALIAEGEPAESIVAFTFTEKAAAELKDRIRLRVTAKVGETATDQLGRLFVGTIHAYCFRLLQTYVPKYETYTPLDQNQLTNLLNREKSRIDLKQFGGGRLFKGIANFQRNVDVVENELIDHGTLPFDGFHSTLIAYYGMLDDYRFMSFGTQIVRAVEELSNTAVHAAVTSDLRHLIVDEYQDVNPAQEKLIQLLAKPRGSADLVVVGDDDQAIYQWRGSAVSNIITFADRYPDVTQFKLLVNRRSMSPIVELANGFAQTIPERLAKVMKAASGKSGGPGVSFAVGFDDEATEADTIAFTVKKFHQQGVAYRDIAILVRGRAAYPKLLDALDVARVPVQPGGRTGLFQQPDAAMFGATYTWLRDLDWSPIRFAQRTATTLDDLVGEYRDTFALTDDQGDALRSHLEEWKARTEVTDFNVDLVGDFYDLLTLLGVAGWDTEDDLVRNRLGTIARFTTVLADYESVTRRARRDPSNVSEQKGGQPGGSAFYWNLGSLLANYANANYDDFDGEEDLSSEGVTLATVHSAKGLEWPVVFLPSLTKDRFPSKRTGQAQDWLVPQDRFDVTRYEGTDADERRLFYVAVTRARDWVSLSSHLKVTKNAVKVSPYLEESQSLVTGGGHPKDVKPKGIETPDLAVTYSELAAYTSCPQSYLLRSRLGFMPTIQPELGYGNAVHHLMRMVAEHTQKSGAVPTPKQLNDLINSDFFLPFASTVTHKEMREKARKLVLKYVGGHMDDLRRTWATERSFELYLPGIVVSGRADVIYDEVDGQPDNLAIVDYKTSTGSEVEPLQLQVYADAGRREGLTVGAAFIHDMSTTTRHEVAIDAPAIAAAEAQVVATAEALKARDFTPKPELSKCKACDVRAVCRSAKLL